MREIDAVQEALKRIWRRLLAALGERAPRFEAELLLLLRQLDADDSPHPSEEVRRLIRAYASGMEPSVEARILRMLEKLPTSGDFNDGRLRIPYAIPSYETDGLRATTEVADRVREGSRLAKTEAVQTADRAREEARIAQVQAAQKRRYEDDARRRQDEDARHRQDEDARRRQDVERRDRQVQENTTQERHYEDDERRRQDEDARHRQDEDARRRQDVERRDRQVEENTTQERHYEDDERRRQDVERLTRELQDRAAQDQRDESERRNRQLQDRTAQQRRHEESYQSDRVDQLRRDETARQARVAAEKASRDLEDRLLQNRAAADAAALERARAERDAAAQANMAAVERARAEGAGAGQTWAERDGDEQAADRTRDNAGIGAISPPGTPMDPELLDPALFKLRHNTQLTQVSTIDGPEQAQNRHPQQVQRITRPVNSRHVLVTVWYATDRNHQPSEPPSMRYGIEQHHPPRGGSRLQYGTVAVSIPDFPRHKEGRVESPKWYRLQFRENPNLHITVRAVTERDHDEWIGTLQDAVGESTNADPLDTSQDLLVFVHGYRTSWADAAKRAAQFSYDLKFQGPTIMYTWPSQGKVLAYSADEDQMDFTIPHFIDLLRDLLSHTGARRVHLVAHSMGNRITTAALRAIADDHTIYPTPVHQIVFAAPDVNAGAFREFVERFNALVASFEPPRAPHLTLYTCGVDWALDLSRRIHNHRLERAGDARDGIVIALPMDTIEVTESVLDDNHDDVFGHAYFCSNRAIINDINGILLRGEGPDARVGLHRAEFGSEFYWRM